MCNGTIMKQVKKTEKATKQLKVFLLLYKLFVLFCEHLYGEVFKRNRQKDTKEREDVKVTTLSQH